MPKYSIILWLSSPSLRKEIDLRTFTNELNDAKKFYNSVSEKSQKNIKKITLMEIRESEIRVELTSMVRLTKPIIALKTFSHYLASKTNLSALVRKRALWRGTSTEILEQENYISSEAILTKVVHLAFSSKPEDILVFEEIRKILLNSNL